MSSVLENSAVRDAVLPISVEQYHRLGEAGIIARHADLIRTVGIAGIGFPVSTILGA